jgi:hypothetical protein
VTPAPSLKTLAMRQHEQKMKRLAQEKQRYEVELASSYLTEVFGGGGGSAGGSAIDLSTPYLAKEFGGDGDAQQGSGPALEGGKDGEMWAGGVSTRGMRKAREEVRHWNNPYWPYSDPHNTCTVTRNLTGGGRRAAPDQPQPNAPQAMMTLRAPSRIGEPIPPGQASGGGGSSSPDKSQWWQNRTRFWSGRLRAAPAGTVRECLHDCVTGSRPCLP